MTNSNLCSIFTRYFIKSPLTPLILIVIVALGIIGLIKLPREEEPQISVPMVDILLQADGLRAQDVESLVTKPLETIIKSIEGVEHIYSQTEDNKAVVTARFYVGSSRDNAVLRIHEKIRAHLAEIPYAIPMPIIAAKSIDDVAILVINLTPKPNVADRWTDANLFEFARDLQQELMKSENLGESYIVGGRPQQIRMELLAEKMLLYDITIDQVISKIKGANLTSEVGSVRYTNKDVTVNIGQSLQNFHDLSGLLITNYDQKPIYLNSIANITFDGKPIESRAWNLNKKNLQFVPVVSIAFGKRAGSNAVEISKEARSRLEIIKKTMLPESLDVTIVRDYGQTAEEKADRLLEDLIGATISVVILVMIALGRRESLVVLVVIPATIVSTLFVAWISGYTINRVSLFALIFSIGILVDDAIVFIENIVRHWRLNQSKDKITAAVEAVEEVGRPTIVATITIILALLPMLFVSGMMGPYMSPIPVNASMAMMISLFMAFAIVPWLLIKFTNSRNLVATNKNENFLSRIYRKYASLLIYDRQTSKTFLKAVFVMTILSAILFPAKFVIVKMLPFDNKSEMVIQIDLQEGSTLEDTDRVMRILSNKIILLSEVENLQLYVGTGAPYNFNGLVKHSYLRNQPSMGEIQINLLAKSNRSKTSHAVALEIRKAIKDLSLPNEIKLKLLEVPPGPPVLATLLAEIYGKNSIERRSVAIELKKIFHQIDFITDIDDSFKNQAQTMRILLKKDKLNFYQINEDTIYATIKNIVGSNRLGYSSKENGRYPVEIVLEMPKDKKIMDNNLFAFPIKTSKGFIRLDSLISVSYEPSSYKIFRHNGYNVEMITAELSGTYEAPIYGMLAVDTAIANHDWGKIAEPNVLFHGQPINETHPSILWDGEWEVTYVTFRDMGLAFIIAIFGIYFILVAQFKNFRTPLVILLPVPLTLIGIAFGHWIFTANFTATSMIGMIALSGIVVRNSLLLVEFIHLKRAEGADLKEALIEAGAVRITPIMLTAIAAMIGAVFMFFDPIFQGLAISLFFGLISSTILTLFAIPALYIIYKTS